MPYASTLAWSWLGYAFAYSIDGETGLKYAGKGFEFHRDSDVEGHLAIKHWLTGMIHMRLNDLISARTSMEEAIRISRIIGAKPIQGRALFALGKVLGEMEPSQMYKAGVSLIQKGMDIQWDSKLKPYYSQALLFLGELNSNVGKAEAAEKNLTRAEKMFKEMGMDYWKARARENLEAL